MTQLMNAITSLIDPESWDEQGGDGSILAIGGTLAINQIPKVHAKVDQLLTALRRESGTPSMVSIDAQWLQLDADQVAKIVGASDKKHSSVGRGISREALRRATGRRSAHHRTNHML